MMDIGHNMGEYDMEIWPNMMEIWPNMMEIGPNMVEYDGNG